MKITKYSSFWQKTCLLLILTICLSFSSQAQFFSSRFSSKKRNPEIPTIIKADTMDFDLSKNVAVFSGNVQVDDVEMQIFCHKMIINFEGNIEKSAEQEITGKKVEKKEENKVEKKAEKKDESAEEGLNKSVKSIICLKNVVIIRKLEEDEEGGGQQKALAGKAVYDVKAGKITLTEKPVLKRGGDSIKGRKIEFWLNSERLNVDGGTELQIRSNPNLN